MSDVKICFIDCISKFTKFFRDFSFHSLTFAVRNVLVYESGKQCDVVIL